MSQLAVLILEKQKREQRYVKIKELLLLIDFTKNIRRHIVHEYIATQLMMTLNNKLVKEIKVVLKELNIVGINIHQYRYYKRLDCVKKYSHIKEKSDDSRK